MEGKQWHNGPVPDQSRSCTDIFCLIIFAIFNLTMLVFGIYSWISGNFQKLTKPYDADGKACGLDYPDYPYIYFASPHSDSLSVTVCVKKCPVQSDSALDCQPNSVVTSCQPRNSADNTKAVQIYDTTETGGRICLPTSQKIKQQISDATGTQGITQKASSLSKSWVIILVALPIAIVLSIIFILIIRFTGSFFVYILLFLTIAALVAFGLFLIIAPQSSSDSQIALKQSRPAAIVVGALCIALAIAIIILIICFRKRIKLAASIVKVSANFVSSNCPILFLPLILFAVMILFLVLWISQALGYYSLGQPVHEKDSYPFQQFKLSVPLKVLLGFHIFYLLWVMFFLIETCDFIVSGTATSWYYKREHPYSQSSQRYRKFHIGSVCMGSFLLAVLGFIKFLYEALTFESQGEEGCMAIWTKCCNCMCYLCVTYLFNCFNSGAYTVIHIKGTAYCASAWDAFSERVKEPVTTVVVSFMEVLFSILLRVGITALTCLICYAMVKNIQPYKTEVTDASLLILVVGFIAFVISSFFVSVYSEAMETIYVCYLVDKEAGGGEDKCPQQIKQFLEEAKGNKGRIQ